MNLTPKQLHILARIRDFRLTKGYSPTMQELADELQVSKVTIFDHIEALIKKGALKRQPNKARSLELKPGALPPDEQKSSRLPLVGTIAAGLPIDAVEDRQYLDLEQLFSPTPSSSSGDRFVLQVRGDSMIDDHIRPGDYVIVQKTSSPRNGQTVVALLDTGEATLKKIYKEKSNYRLQPANPNYQPILIPHHQLQIQGVVIGVIRQYN